MNSKKIKVLQIAFNDLGHGGIQSQIMSLVRELNEHIESDIIVWSKESTFYNDEFNKYGRIFTCHHYEGNSSILNKIDYFVRYYKIKSDVYKILIKYGPYDVVHCHKFFECAPCLAAAKKANVKIRIAHSHNTAIKVEKINIPILVRNLLNNIYRKIINKNATNMIGCSQHAADYLFGKGNGITILNSIDLTKFQPRVHKVKVNKDLKLIHIGNFNSQKNQLFLIDILIKLKELKNDIKLTMIGQNNSYTSLIRKKIVDSYISDFVEILPHNSNVADELSKSDYLIFPSTFEGFGNVLIEAQSMGLKCFVSTEIVPEADVGNLIYISLKKGAEFWANEIYNEYIKNGSRRKIVDVSKFSPKKNAELILKIYNNEVN